MNVEALIALAPLIILAAAAVVVMLAIAVRRRFEQLCGLTCAGIAAALLAVGVVWQETPVAVTGLLVIDTYGLFYIALILLAGLAVVALGYGYFRQRAGENEELLVLLLTALLGAAVLATSNHVASFFIGLEMLSISLFVLVGYAVEQRHSLEAAVKYLLLSGVSSALLAMALALIYAASGTLDFSGIGYYLASQQQVSVLLLLGLVLLVAALGFKLSLAPFHLWTPDVYEGAPAPITALVATVSKGAVFALLLRYFLVADGYAYPSVLTVAGVLAVLSILLGNLLALLQTNVKRILAYSSIAHLGYLLVAFIAAGRVDPVLAVEAVSFYLAVYFITTLGAFGVIASLSTPQHEAVELSLYRGLFWRRPGLAVTFTLMLLSLAGIPLTAGFVGKFYVFAAGAEAELWGLLLTVIVGSGLGLYYYVRIIVEMSKAPAATSAPEPAAAAPEWGPSATLAALTGLLIGFGVYPGPLVEWVRAMALGMG